MPWNNVFSILLWPRDVLSAGCRQDLGVNNLTSIVNKANKAKYILNTHNNH